MVRAYPNLIHTSAHGLARIVTSIVFLAPISAFNQTLAEDPTINRLWDSYDLWKKICGNRLLTRVALVLLLNKRDVLAHKIASGIRVSRFVTSYPEDGPQDADAVATCA